MKLKVLLLLLALTCIASAQNAPVTGTIPASPGTGCVNISVDGEGVVGISVTGTWSGTLQPEISIGGDAVQNANVTPFNSTTSQSTITANGLYRFNAAGAQAFYLCGNTVGSGTANVKLNVVKLSSSLNPASSSSGTVTSVTFTGDGILDSSTPSTAVTSSGTLTATPITQSANTVLAGPTSGAASNPTFRALGAADLPTNLNCPFGGTTAGSAAAQTLTVPNIPATATAGTCVRFVAGFSAAGATTLTVTPTGGSAYAALNLMKRTTAGVAALGAAGDEVTAGIYEAMLDTAAGEWVMATPSSTVYTAGALTAGSMMRGNSNNQSQTSAGISASAGTVFTSYNSEAAAGVGMAFERGVTSQKAETAAADASVLAVTPAATIGTYRLNVVVSVSSGTSCVVGMTQSWTDSNANAQANVAVPLFQLGTAAPALTFTTSAAGNYAGSLVYDVNNGAAAMTTKWVGGGTCAAKVSAVLERLQ